MKHDHINWLPDALDNGPNPRVPKLLQAGLRY